MMARRNHVGKPGTDPLDRARLRRLARLIHERKGEALVALDVSRLFLVDFFLIASCQSGRQLLSLAEEICAWQKKEGGPPARPEGTGESGWVVADLGEIVVHLFLPATRKFYDLELLWGDAPRLEGADLRLPAASVPARADGT